MFTSKITNGLWQEGLLSICSTAVLQIKGYDKVGTQFFRFTAPVAEDVKHVFVAGKRLFALTELSVTTFDESIERCSYTAPEKITAATIAPLLSADTWWPILACQNRTLKVMYDGKVAQVCGISQQSTLPQGGGTWHQTWQNGNPTTSKTAIS